MGFCFLLFAVCFGHASEPPAIPIGLEAYRQWDRWPFQRIGARAYMRSTYDRRGGNEGADASHFLYQLAEDKNVTLDVQGPGILSFVRYNHWHGSPWHYEVDGTDYIVQETSSANPNQPATNSIVLPAGALPNPLTWTWSQTQGADLSWVPIPFEKSFRMGYSRTHYGTGYYIYQQYVPGTKLSQRLRSWSPKIVPDKDVLELISKAGTDLIPQFNTTEGRRLHLQQAWGTVSLRPKSTNTVRLRGGVYNTVAFRTGEKERCPTAIRSLEFSAPRDRALDLGHLRLRIFWDNSPHASVDAPLALLFGAGTFYNRDDREYLVKAFPVSVRFDKQEVHLACFFPMPFFHVAQIELINPGDNSLNVRQSIRYAPLQADESQVGYFHATYRDHPNPEPGKDLVLLNTRDTEGGGDWSGQLVGTSWIFSDRAVLNTLEGDPRFFFDDSQTPQAQGTGTEEWGGGGDYWGGQNMSLPFAGHPTGARKAAEAKCDEDKIESAYRFLLGDMMPFGKNALIRLEHGGQNESTEHYQTVTYWYGLNRPSLIKTDELKIGNTESENSHRYLSPGASAPNEITSRYEWGVDTLNGKEIYSAHPDIGRKTTGTSEFNLKLEPHNLGVMLRRKLDYQFPNQRAEVFIAEVKQSGLAPYTPSPWGKGRGEGELQTSQNRHKQESHSLAGSFKPAGIWYLAGSSTCVYSNPKDELGPAQHNLQTSNRRFRDDEFLIPRKLTEGRSAIRVRIKFTPVAIPLFPGQPVPELAWTELRYDAYCFVIPERRK